jgi:hypothetical protein
VRREKEKQLRSELRLDYGMTSHFTANCKTTQINAQLSTATLEQASATMSSLNTNDRACQNSRTLQRLQHSDSLYDALSFGMSQQMLRDGMPPSRMSTTSTRTSSLTLIDILDDALRIMEDDEDMLREIAALEPSRLLSRD